MKQRNIYYVWFTPPNRLRVLLVQVIIYLFIYRLLEELGHASRVDLQAWVVGARYGALPHTLQSTLKHVPRAAQFLRTLSIIARLFDNHNFVPLLSYVLQNRILFNVIEKVFICNTPGRRLHQLSVAARTSLGVNGGVISLLLGIPGRDGVQWGCSLTKAWNDDVLRVSLLGLNQIAQIDARQRWWLPQRIIQLLSAP